MTGLELIEGHLARPVALWGGRKDAIQLGSPEDRRREATRPALEAAARSLRRREREQRRQIRRVAEVARRFRLQVTSGAPAPLTHGGSFHHGGHVSHVHIVPRRLSPTEAERLRAEWRAAHGDGPGRLLVVEGNTRGRS